MITLKTSKGDIKIKLFEKEAPITVKNFLDYIDAGFYKGTIFHRVIPGFMVQGGGFTADFVQKPTQRSDQERGGQPAFEQARHTGDGPHQRHRLGDGPVLHQSGR